MKIQYLQIPANSFIFKQGDPSNKFYGIIKGKVKYTDYKPADENANEKGI